MLENQVIGKLISIGGADWSTYGVNPRGFSNSLNLQYRYSADVDWCIRVMYQTEQRHMSLRRVPTVLVNYLEGGMSIKNHRASLRERFAVMRSHYGLFTTLTMHVWFVLRNLKSI